MLGVVVDGLMGDSHGGGNRDGFGGAEVADEAGVSTAGDLDADAVASPEANCNTDRGSSLLGMRQGESQDHET